ncbi:2OG-Fe(II) oxygenase family protein [Dactylosporangium sp. CA-233914]|uniref:2OG-Fe(II) oxygenase family protein n=1 Tax=Dactylosporangium sp. CA-233914 TaxID=3239934 RepID=UPI003D8DADA5
MLFGIFHYPPSPPGASNRGTGEHTGYGLLTLLLQDDNGGPRVRVPGGEEAEEAWIDAAPIPGTFVCNIGDMLDRLAGGWYRSTPHRVRNVSGNERLSFPFFFGPDFAAEVPPLPGRTAAGAPAMGRAGPSGVQRYVRRLSGGEGGQSLCGTDRPDATRHPRRGRIVEPSEATNGPGTMTGAILVAVFLA